MKDMCKNFVATLGSEPGYIFSIFGVKLVEKHRTGFLNAWMMAWFLCQTPMINKENEGVFDMDLFDKVEWARFSRLKRRDKRMDFLKAFGLRKSYEGNLHKQFHEDLSKASPRSTGQEPPAMNASKSFDDALSKDTKSPIKEKVFKEYNFDEEPPPSSSVEDNSDTVSVPSLVQPKKLYESSAEEDSDDSRRDKKIQDKKYRKKMRKIINSKNSKESQKERSKQTTPETGKIEKSKTKPKRNKGDSGDDLSSGTDTNNYC
jgi:hypothetical protein